MIKIDLITGFLGAGKTTFLREYASYFIRQGKNIGILENDYGAVNVDMMLLQDLQGEQCELEMVSGGCDRDCHRRRFKTKLISMGMCGYDRVLVEPSGIFEMDEFFDVLQEEPLDRWYEIGNVIAIAEASQGMELSSKAEYILATEAAHAGMIVLSKVQEASEEQIFQTKQALGDALKAVKCSRKIEEDQILCKDWKEFTEADFELIASCGYEKASYVKQDVENSEFSSLFFMNLILKQEELEARVREILDSPKCGTVFRVKGFQRLDNDQWIEVNGTKQGIQIRPIAAGQEILIVIGEDLRQEEIERILQGNSKTV